MATQTISIARIYLREASHKLPQLIELLHDQEKVSGVTVLRGIAGFGDDGRLRTASLVDLSLDLPLVVEFFDSPERVTAIVEQIQSRLALMHIITWSAHSHST